MSVSVPSGGIRPALRYVLANSLDSIEEGRLRLVEFLAPMVGNDAGRIVVGVLVLDDEIEITFEDNGVPFNPLAEKIHAQPPV